MDKDAHNARLSCLVLLWSATDPMASLSGVSGFCGFETFSFTKNVFEKKPTLGNNNSFTVSARNQAKWLPAAGWIAS